LSDIDARLLATTSNYLYTPLLDYANKKLFSLLRIYISSNLLLVGFYILPPRPMQSANYYFEKKKKVLTYSVNERKLECCKSCHSSQKDAERNLVVHFVAFGVSQCTRGARFSSVDVKQVSWHGIASHGKIFSMHKK
jgi:hypothetical protein